ncbi:MAG: hypothetical protein ACK47B_06230 [Armatimonadota bacterium]
MERKACADCGSLCLGSERRCWACGSSSFMSAADDDRTLLAQDASDQTLMLRLRRRPWLVPVALGSAFAVAVFIGTVGYWIGRASSLPEGTVLGPMAGVFPVPDVPSSSAHTPGGGGQTLWAPARPVGPSAVTPRERVKVTVRPGERAEARLQDAPAAGAWDAREVPPAGEMVLPPAYAPPVQPPARTVVPFGPAAAAPSVPVPEVPLTQPPGHAAVVEFRNEDAAAVEITVDGEDLRVRVAARGVMPVQLKPGTYRLRASSSGLASDESRLTVTAGKAYTLAVRRQRGASGEALVLVEPLAAQDAG